MEQRNEIIFTLKCPKCDQDLPQGLRKEEMLRTLKVNCPVETCKWEGLAETTKVKKQSLEEWMGPQYNATNSTITQEEFWKMYNQHKKQGGIDLDEHFKDKK